MIYEVRVFDGKGNLKETITEFDLDAHKFNKKKFPEHECKAYGCTELTTKRNYCSKECQQRVTAKRAKNKRDEKNASRPKLFCFMCKQELVSPRTKYCGEFCETEGRRKKEQEAKERIDEILKQRKGELKNA